MKPSGQIWTLATVLDVRNYLLTFQSQLTLLSLCEKGEQSRLVEEPVAREKSPFLLILECLLGGERKPPGHHDCVEVSKPQLV